VGTSGHDEVSRSWDGGKSLRSAFCANCARVHLAERLFWRLLPWHPWVRLRDGVVRWVWDCVADSVNSHLAGALPFVVFVAAITSL
jgi:hypothetical protein